MGVRSPDAPKQPARTRGKKAAPREANCRLVMGSGKTRVARDGVAVLAEDELRFHTGRTGRGGKDFFLHLAYADMTSLAADLNNGTLTIEHAEQGTIVFHIARYAADWKKLIEERPHPLDVLGVKPTSRIAVAGVDDEEFLEQLAGRVPSFATSVAGDGELDLAFVGAEHRADLPRLVVAARRVTRPRGIVWAVFPVGAGTRTLTALDIAAAVRPVGLIAGGIVVLSRTHEALRLTPV